MTTPNPINCARCGEVHKGCVAHARTGKPCGMDAVEHTTVCRYHGALTPRTVAAIERRRTEEAARRMVQRFGLDEETNAGEQLTRLINISAGLVGYYKWQCMQLKPDALVWGDFEVKHDFHGLSVTQKAEMNMWLRLFNEERRELRALCIAAIGAGLAEREVRLAEQHGALVAEVLRLVLSDLQLTPEQQTRALNVVPMRLREYGVEHPESDTTVVSDSG